MYLRFVVADRDEDSERALGVFHAVWNLCDAGKLYAHEEEHHDSVRWWFHENLENPTRFTGSRPFYRKKSRAISWFKDSATEHLARARELVAILETHGVPVHMLKAQRVGYSVYEDEYQVVAEPFSDMTC